MIPKIVHYIWFGGNPYSDKIQKCIDSWHKYLPEYEFMLWNEDTFNIDESCDYVRQAYANKKWAFVSDYVRVWALNKYGGVYLDTDVEVRKSLDNFLGHNMVLGTDELGHLTAFMASSPNQPLWQDILELYHSMQFVNPDGSFNMTVNNSYLENRLAEYGYKIANEMQHLDKDIEVYPDDWFHAADHMSGILNITDNTHAIHWHTLTWCDTSTHVNRFIRVKILGRILGKKRANKLFNKLHELIRR